jgi:ribosomal protein L14E/L6E/L27E
MELTKGQVVYSKSGHDKGLVFIVVDEQDGYVFLADGKLRKLEHPKRKKIKHVQITNFVVEDIKKKLEDGSYLLDADISKALKEYDRR